MMKDAMEASNINESLMSENLKNARELVKFLECGDVEKAEEVINEMYLSRENTMFQNLGKLTRELHETMNDISSDAHLTNIMHQQMPDARHNLNHVIDLTEDAANQTLTAIEHSTPLLNKINEQAIKLQTLLQEGTLKHVEHTRPLFPADEIIDFLDMVCIEVASINKNMNSIVVAQGFQDISGQIIQRVSKMVQDVEHSLVSILKVSSSCNSDNSNYIEVKSNAGYGPATPATKKDDIVNDQDEVDDLLSTLGF